MHDAIKKPKRQYYNLPEGKLLEINGLLIGLHLSGTRRGRRGTITIEGDAKVRRLDKRPPHKS